MENAERISPFRSGQRYCSFCLSVP